MNRSSMPLPLGLVLTLCLSAPGCHHEAGPRAEDAKLLVTSPLRKDTELTREYVAQVRAIQHIEVRALEKGYLQHTSVDEGQRIGRGHPMFQIAPMLHQAEVQKATAEADLSAIEYGNTKLLADRHVVSSNELALANARLNKAKAEVALAATHRAWTELRAPFDGTVGRLHLRTGSLVNEGDLLTTLSDSSTVWVYFNVSEVEYLRYSTEPAASRAAPVRLVLANGELFDQPGKVETLESDFQAETGNIAFRAAFPNPKGLLRHGETGKVLMSTPLKGALILPQKATFDVLDKKLVYVVDAKGVVRSRPITVAAELPHVYVIQAGVDEHDRVLVEGLRKVHEGATVDVDYRDPTEVLAHLEVRAE